MVPMGTIKKRTTQNNRGSPMKLVLPFLMSLFPVALGGQSQSPSPQPPTGGLVTQTTEVMVVMTARQGVTR